VTSKIGRGTKVKIPKGTPIRSMHPDPNKKSRVALRNQVVTVHHTLSAYRHLLAYQYANSRLYFLGSRRDQYTLCEGLGLPCRTDAEVQTSLESLVAKATVEPYSSESRTNLLWIEKEPAKVCWAGAGGYWCEAPLSAVQIITPKS
jgi:hypothetical protein